MISRRSFGLTAAASAALSAFPRVGNATPTADGGWRRFAVTTRLDLAEATGAAQAWLPLAGVDQPDWVRVDGNRWRVSPNGEADRVTADGATLLHVRFGAGARFVEAVSIVATRGRATAFETRRAGFDLSPGDRTLFLRGTAAVPTDGPIKALADRITAGRTGDLDKAKTLYQWVVVNTFRSAPVRGCGEGDLLAMVESGVFGGKCADINPLFVALARASGLPARDLYGIRVAPSQLGYRSLGPATAAITKAQHCRAEVFLDGFGWTAMDPADVRKVMLEETPAGLPIDDPMVAAARARLFGGWEGNWLPFNAQNDVVLPGRRDPRPVRFLMYPQVETAAGISDCYDPERVRYTITAEELAI